jgi:chlorite dismutase
VDLSERGADRQGVPQVMNRRIFMQLLVFRAPDGAQDVASLAKTLAGELAGKPVGSVIYADVNDPSGLALLTFAEDPARFVDVVRPVLAKGDLAALRVRPEMSMLGRTYSSGYEQDLAFWLLDRPVKTALDPKHPWAVWYPLRRVGAFNRLERSEQGAILREHGEIGRAYGEADLAHDIRLACHGLDTNDNEFVIGLIGAELHPLSHVVQAMRKTRQTSEFMAQMGPFFVGYALHRNAPAGG